MANLRVDLDFTGIDKKVSTMNFNRGRFAMANQALADMNNKVPMKNGDLRNSGHVAPDGSSLTWNTPYARQRFYVGASKYTTPGTGKRWDLKAKSKNGETWVKAFVKGAGL